MSRSAIMSPTASMRFVAPLLGFILAFKDVSYLISVGALRLNPFWLTLAAGVVLASVEQARASFRSRTARHRWPIAPGLLMLGLMPAAAAVSFIPSSDPGKTLLYAGRLAGCWLLALYFGIAIQDRSTARRSVQAFVAGGVVLVIVGALQVWAPSLHIGSVNAQRILLEDPSTYVRPAGFYMDSNFFATHLVVAALLAFGLASSGERPARGQWAWFLAAGVQLTMVVMTYSRSALVMLAVGLLPLLARMRNRHRASTIAVVAVALTVGAVLANPTTVSQRVATIAEPQRPGSNMTRLLLATSAVRMAVDHFPLGVGLESFDDVYPRYQDHRAQVEIVHPHEVPFSFVAETGLLGLVAILATLYSVVRAGLVWFRSTPGDSWAVWPAAAAVLIGSLFQYFLYFEVLWLLLGFVLADRGFSDACA